MATQRWSDVEPEPDPDGDVPGAPGLEDDLCARIRAHKLAEIRRSRHLTREQLAATLGVSTARVSQIEHGSPERAAVAGLASYVTALGGRLELVADFGDERLVIG
jgi:Helix-turn-helix domain